MSTALSCFLAVLISSQAIAQQEPPKPSQTTPPITPAEAKPVEVKPKPVENLVPPARTSPGVDPARMAAPKPADTRKAGGPVDDNTYVLGAEDQIGIQVNNSPEFNGTHLIRPDGRITINLVGEITAAGLTPAQLTELLVEKVKKYVVEPDVTVSVLAVNSKRFFIQGEVNHTGEFKLLVPTKVLEALVNAGGFRDFAKTKDIIIIREEGTTTTRLHFNYKDVIKGKHLEQNIFLKQGDIIVVR
jgi:polysaccharide export outer membrane protein